MTPWWIQTIFIRTVSQEAAPPLGTQFSIGKTRRNLYTKGESFCQIFRWKTVSQEAAPILWTQLSIGKFEGTFRVKAFVRISDGELCPKRRRRLLGHSFPYKELEGTFRLQTKVIFSEWTTLSQEAASPLGTQFSIGKSL